MAVFDELKSIAQVLQEAGKIDLYEKILAIQQQLLEMQEKIRIQDTEIRDFKDKLKIKADLVFEKSAYWIKKDDGSKEGPYCPTCWEKDNKVIHLLQQRPNWDIWGCNLCKAVVFGTGVCYKEKSS